MSIVIRVENLSKRYRLGLIGTTTLSSDLNRWWAKLRGKPDPTLKIGQEALANSDGQYVWALKDANFEVKQGEILGIIGRNGAGKSTLLKILTRVTAPTSGTAKLKGRVASLLEVGTGFHPELTGRENIYLNGAVLGMSKSEIARKFDEIVDFSEVEQFIDTPVKRYSSGMYVRLAFAVAAHLDPEILLVDEVLAVGDADFQKKCIGMMKQVGNSGRTILFVSHNMNAIEQLCSSIVLLQQGHLVHDGKEVRDIINAYLFGNNEEAPAHLWVNDRNQYVNPWFKPLRFFLADHEGTILQGPQSNSTDFWIHIEGEIQSTDPSLTVGYTIFTEDGQLLYWSYQTDSDPDSWPQLRKGLCFLRSKIPKRLLNEGIYRIELIGGLHYRQWLFKPGTNAPHIFLRIQGGLSDSPLWMVKRPGLLAPVLDWSCNEDNEIVENEPL
jgi:lipopolysaccharide transport system ATP-binding protein